MTTIEELKEFLGEDADLFDFTVEGDAILAKPNKWLERSRFVELAEAFKEFDGKYVDYNIGFAIPLTRPGEDEPSQGLEPVGGVIEKVEWTSDKKWFHIFLQGERVPLALEPGRVTEDLKPGAYLDGRVSPGRQWCFIRDFTVHPVVKPGWAPETEEGVSKAAVTPPPPSPAEQTEPEEETAAETTTPPGLLNFHKASEQIPPPSTSATPTTPATPVTESPAEEPASLPTPLPTDERTDESTDEEEASYLESSYKALGPLVPKIVAADGETLDGLHREKFAKDWPVWKAADIVDPIQKALARLVINVCRRQVPAEEKTKLLGNIAKLTGWTPQQIAKALGMSYPWVMRYLPDEYKERPGAGGPTPVIQRITQEGRPEPRRFVVPGVQWGAEWVTCSQCKVATMEPLDWKGKPVCHVCYEKLTAPPPPPLEEGEPTETPPEKKLPNPEPVKPQEIDTGLLFDCPECHQKFLIIHVSPSEHKFQPVREEPN